MTDMPPTPAPPLQVTVGELVASSALQRKESRGGHFCIEYPAELEEQRREVVIAASLRKRADLSLVKRHSATASLFGSLAAGGARRELSVCSSVD